MRWLVAVVAVMVVLTAGWPLINSEVSNRHALPPGTRLTVGPGHGMSGQITVGPGWSLLSAGSDQLHVYSLRNRVVELDVDYVGLVNIAQMRQLWAGLRELLKVRYAGVYLGPRSVTTSANGRIGMTRALSGAHRTGLVTVFVGPSRRFAVEMIMLVPRGARYALLVPGLKIIRSMQFPAGS